MSSWRNLLPSTWRDILLPRREREPAELPPLPPWHAAAGPPVRLESHRFEHAGAHHRLQFREHADGSGLVVVDARRIARLDAAGLARLRGWISSGAKDAPSQERALWGEPVLTGAGPVRSANAWDFGARAARPVPEVPLVATLEVVKGLEDEMPARARALHALGIPHAIFRPVAEGTKQAVIAGVRAAEDLGLVAGVAAPSQRLEQPGLLEELAALGLDHLSLPIAGADAASHDAVLGPGDHARVTSLAARAAELEIPLTGEVPLVAANWTSAAGILAVASRLGMKGVTAWALVDPGSSDGRALHPRMLRQVATTFEDASDTTALAVTWAAPARIAPAGDPTLEHALREGPRADGDFGMRVTEDGSILPPRGARESAGRLGAATWSDIAASASWRAFQRQAEAPTRCAECPGLALCAVDCPADPEGWA